jgi:hypothetical protein
MGINVVETVASFDGLVAGKRGADCAGSSATLRWLAIYAHGVEQWLSLMKLDRRSAAHLLTRDEATASRRTLQSCLNCCSTSKRRGVIS